MLFALLLLPLACAPLLLWLRPTMRRQLVVATGLVHFALTAICWVVPASDVLGGRIGLDALGLLFLTVSSALFVLIAIYAAGYLASEDNSPRRDFEQNLRFVNAPDVVFQACMLAFLFAVTLVTTSRHLGILWVALEATTLATAPMIYFHRHQRSLEATWKYLLVCSVGIAMALLGTFFLSVATKTGTDAHVSLNLPDLVRHAGGFQVPWLKAAFICMLVGYGTKMGLAPLHTWAPDAYGEAPSVFSALSSGVLLNGAFLGILRAMQVCVAAGQPTFAQDTLVALGLTSLVVSAALILRQTQYKRMLAYSSVEHAGLMALGVGLGGTAVTGALLHALNHGVTPRQVRNTPHRLAAGNLTRIYASKQTAEVRGAFRVTPTTSSLFMAGALAITGAPPFSIFTSKFLILAGAFGPTATVGAMAVGVATLTLLLIVFAGFMRHVTAMMLGPAEPPRAGADRTEYAWAVIPLVVLCAMALGAGIWLPPGLVDVLREIAPSLGGTSS